MDDRAPERGILPFLVDAGIVVAVMVGLNVVRFGTRWPTVGDTAAHDPHLAWIISSVLLGALVAFTLHAIEPDGRRAVVPMLTRGVVAVLIGSVGLMALSVVSWELVDRWLAFSVVNLAVLAILGPALFLAVRLVGTKERRIATMFS